MSYISQICNIVTEEHKSINKIVLDKREKKYYNILFRRKRSNATMIKHYKVDEKKVEQLRQEGWEKIKEWTDTGWEIVKEINVCETCYKRNAIKHEKEKENND